jgi:hypothetical protein
VVAVLDELDHLLALLLQGLVVSLEEESSPLEVFPHVLLDGRERLRFEGHGGEEGVVMQEDCVVDHFVFQSPELRSGILHHGNFCLPQDIVFDLLFLRHYSF